MTTHNKQHTLNSRQCADDSPSASADYSVFAGLANLFSGPMNVLL